MKTEFPADLTRTRCLDDDCDWIGEITDLVLVHDNDGALYCICPECASTVFVEYNPSRIPKTEKPSAKVQDQRHYAQPVS